MYTNVVQHCNCQSQNNFSTLNITLTSTTTYLLDDINFDKISLISKHITEKCWEWTCVILKEIK